MLSIPKYKMNSPNATIGQIYKSFEKTCHRPLPGGPTSLGWSCLTKRFPTKIHHYKSTIINNIVNNPSSSPLRRHLQPSLTGVFCFRTLANDVLLPWLRLREGGKLSHGGIATNFCKDIMQGERSRWSNHTFKHRAATHAVTISGSLFPAKTLHS